MRPFVNPKGASKVESKMSCCARGMEMNMSQQQNNDKCNIPKAKCSLAMAYVPWQKWENMYDDEMALEIGTAFPSLNLPFLGRGVIE